MQKIPFNENWSVTPRPSPFDALIDESDSSEGKRKVNLPHDAVLELNRSATDSDGSHTGYFPGGAWRYEKTFDVPLEWESKVAIFEFEGVYRDAMIYINESFAGHWANGYSRFYVDASPFLKLGQENTLRVEARAYRDSRWYTGGGIYRPVSLLLADQVHIVPEGPRVSTTEALSGVANVLIETDITNSSTTTRTVEVRTKILTATGETVAFGAVPITVMPGETLPSTQRLFIQDPQLWSAEDPYLYDVTIEVCTTESDGSAFLDGANTILGVREISADPLRGFQVNGRTVKLRGACIHHDNGIMGSATFDASEQRRVRIMKDAGFNAVRSAHNPLSSAFLRACDQQGMYVMDETFDMWAVQKTDHDYALQFDHWWKKDVDSLIARDFNHPSVVMYSVGNEVIDIVTPLGSRTGRKIADRIRRSDASRLIVNSMNPAVAASDLVAALLAGGSRADEVIATLPEEAAKKVRALAGRNSEQEAAGVNAAISMTDVMQLVMSLPEIDQLVAEPSSYVDVVGYNYGEMRYREDHAAHPERVFVGSETFAPAIDELWRNVITLPYLIGDFTWVGWDYLGEAGIGQPKYPDEQALFAAPYPWITASCGDIDITGVRKPVSYYREVVFGLRKDPYLAVQDPLHVDHPSEIQGWSWTDAVRSWNWDIAVGQDIIVEAYVDADEVVFTLDDSEVARCAVGEEKGYVARAKISYVPGTLAVHAYKGSELVGSDAITTTGQPTQLKVKVSQDDLGADIGDLAYVTVNVVDDDGNVVPNAEIPVKVTVAGGGALQGLGTARPSTEESFLDTSTTTFQGHALAAIRSDGSPQDIIIRVSSDGFPTAVAKIEKDN